MTRSKYYAKRKNPGAVEVAKTDSFKQLEEMYMKAVKLKNAQGGTEDYDSKSKQSKRSRSSRTEE